MKIDYGPEYRVYYLSRGNIAVVLLVGGDKSSQEGDIRKAKKLAENPANQAIDRVWARSTPAEREVKILLDENLDRRLRTSILSHYVFTARYVGFSGIKNGKLLEADEREKFDLPITGDQSLRREQNLSDRRLAIIALSSVAWRMLRN